MRRMAILLVLALSLTGCSGSPSGELEAADDGNDAAGQESSTTTSAPTTTLAPTTTTTAAPVATQRSLLNAIPTATELPPGWADPGEAPTTDLKPLSGDGFGYCGGPNAAQRAVNANVTDYARKWGWQTDGSGQWGTLSLWAFESEDDASAFMASTESAVSSCSTEELEVPELVEGRDDDTTDYRIDIFAGPGEPDEPWELTQRTSLGGAAADGADEAFFIKQTQVFLGAKDGSAYGVTLGHVAQFERHGTVVMALKLDGNCCVFGFSNTESTDEDALPQYPALQAAADHLRAGILAELFNNADA